MNGDCEYKFDGYDTDGQEWYLCIVHNELEPDDNAPCDGYEEIPYQQTCEHLNYHETLDSLVCDDCKFEIEVGDSQFHLNMEDK